MISTLAIRSKAFAIFRRIFCNGGLKDYTEAILESPSVWNDLTCGVVTKPPIPNWIIVSSKSDFLVLRDDEGDADNWEEDDSVWSFESPIRKLEDDGNKDAHEVASSTDEGSSDTGSSYAFTPNSWQSSSLDDDASILTLHSWRCERLFL